MVELLKAIPKDVFGALATVIGGVLAGVVAVVVMIFNNRATTQRLRLQLVHDREAQRHTLLREKLEDLYITSSKWFVSLDSYFQSFRIAMREETPQDKTVELFHSYVSDQNDDRQRTGMLIELYFPQLEEAFALVQSTLQEGRAIVREYVYQPKRNHEDDMRYLGSLNTWFKRYE
jgi:hypothetical protein